MSADTHTKFCPYCGACLGVASVNRVHCLACGAPSRGDYRCSHCNRLFGPVTHQLTFNVGPLSGMVFRIPEGIYPVGRDVLAPRDYSISRQHLQVACVNGAVYVADAGSTNRTYVAGRFADEPIRLTPNVELSIAGNTGTYTSNL